LDRNHDDLLDSIQKTKYATEKKSDIASSIGMIAVALFEFRILFRSYGHFMVYPWPLNVILVSWGIYALSVGTMTIVLLGIR
jgi:hypothetical protein